MSEETTRPEEDGEGQLYEVVELEVEAGETAEWVILDTTTIDGKNYKLMVPAEDMEYAEQLTEEELQQFFAEEDPYVVMREQDKTFFELEEAEFESVKERLEEAFFSGEDEKED